MGYESEHVLEGKLIDHLSSNGYERVIINNSEQLHLNFKKQLEIQNKTTLSNKEFSRVIEHLKGGDTFSKARKLRDKFELRRDDETVSYIEFLDVKEWCKNRFQVTNQVTMKGKYENRYDVTLLINGLPLVQIELKRRGIELKEAYNQITRYKQHSYGDLFGYIQIFIISNGVNTKYFSNNAILDDFKQTFYWTDKDNKRLSDLEEFAFMFLEKCHISKMISRYIVLNESERKLMVLRPYQYYAVEAFLDRAINTTLNGYVWHTTGSGKTLTSFKLSEILSETEKIDKVIFLVDRKDLDYQTMKEFNNFSAGSVDTTDNTIQLVKNMATSDNKLVITTIQKLNNALKKKHFSKRIEDYKTKKVIFIIDECHRSQFGEMHTEMKKFFSNAQYFGFTGTPIFAENANVYRTTKDLFDKRLHQYLIKDAIADNNVLGFSVEYIGKHVDKSSKDEEVEGIDKKGYIHSEKRLKPIVKHILDNHKSKTVDMRFNSIFAVDGIPTLIKYYDLFKGEEHNLKIATIFTYNPNEEIKEKHSRDRLEEYIKDYNVMFGTNYSTDTFNEYYSDISKRVKNKQIDIVLVVNMFLTGFDSRSTNTLYVDKNLKYHNLIQAYSRTNRINGILKPHGNIVCFRQLKEETDEAITLYSNNDPGEDVLLKSYKDYVKQTNQLIKELKAIAPTVKSVDDLQSEEEILKFVFVFRNINRELVRLKTFVDFKYDDLYLDEQEIEDYRSKYLDIYDGKKEEKEKVSILDDIDFEIELMHKDYINVDYILNLLNNLDNQSETYERDIETIIKEIDNAHHLRSKKDLIKEFILEQLPKKDKDYNVVEYFNDCLEIMKDEEINAYSEGKNVDVNLIRDVVGEYEFNNRINSDIINEMFTDYNFLAKRQAKKDTEVFVKEICERYTY
ncbi:type I restriction endonuclease subunit R [Mycoplasmatota bacterium WC44]